MNEATLLRAADRVRVLLLEGDTRQSLPMMRALRTAGRHVTVACESRLSPGWMSRYPHRRVLVPSPEHRPAEFLAAVEALVSGGRYDVTIPLFDLSAHLVSENKLLLERHTRVPVPDFETFLLARDKARTMRICQEHGVPCPRTYFPDEMPLGRIAAGADYPVLVKPRVSHGAVGIRRVDAAAELAGTLERATREFGPCLVQELIPQSDLQYKAELFRDGDGSIRAQIVFSKGRYFPVTGGTSSINQTVRRDDILATSRRLLDLMGWVGYADLDFIHDPRDGVAKVMEINPRTTGSIKIAFEAGIDFADLLVRQALGQRLPTVRDYRVGITMRYLPLDILWFLYSPERFRARPSWFRFWGGDLCYQVLSLRDPGPFLALALGGLRRLMSPKVRAEKLRVRRKGER